MEGKIPYTQLELTILKNIPENGQKISTIDLTDRCYQPDRRPRNARQSVLSTANRLIQKSDENNEEWELFKSKQKGSEPLYFWREPRKKREK